MSLKRTQADVNSDGDVNVDTCGAQPGTKRPRLSKPREKKYACAEDGCDKFYSRAEHLYRHQLNHVPKEIYFCEFSGCERSFVRQDLCMRHRERHTKANSHLSRKDASRVSKGATIPSNASSVPERDASHPTGAFLQQTDCLPRRASTSAKPDVDASATTLGPQHADNQSEVDSSAVRLLPPLARRQSISQAPQLSQSGSNGPLVQANGASTMPSEFSSVQPNLVVSSDHAMQSLSHNHGVTATTFSHPMRLSMPLVVSGQSSDLDDTYGMRNLDSIYSISQQSSVTQSLPLYVQTDLTSTRAEDNTGVPEAQSLPSFDYPLMNMPYSGGMGSNPVPSYTQGSVVADAQLPVSMDNVAFQGPALLDRIPTAMTIPVFNNDTFNRVQPGQGDEFIGWLFGDDSHQPQFNGLTYQIQDNLNGMQPSHSTVQLSNVEPLSDITVIPSVVDSNNPESFLTDLRRQRLLKIIKDDFRNERHLLVSQIRERILRGELDEDSHVLSLHMLQTYISSFWLHIHTQLPILHRPTFSAETCPDLLLIAILALGASCLDKNHRYEVSHASAELSFFLAWHGRHLIYEDVDFVPPAKLWVFQALLILETLEKMYSTRSLHERAHVHHATTLTLMRRGSSLLGRSAVESSPYDNDPTRTPPGPNGSINTSGRNTPDAWWNHWISNEATRRTAFAAFIIDTTHATIFGHSAVMAVHEMRIPLPCDETLWSATSGAEVRRLVQELTVREQTPLSFLEGLKKTLLGHPMKTNTFGRVIIMSGLLSISWNQKMQDMRVNSTGVGELSSWGSQLLHAFDHWRRDFDSDLGTPPNIYLQNCAHPPCLDTDNVFESRNVLYCLAHMAMHVDIIECQIFAGAKRLLGRTVTTNEHAAVVKKMKEVWAPSVRARHATFYALRFLSEVLKPTDASAELNYSARDDNLLNRPWVLYLAALVVWSYGFALDGPMAPPTYIFTTPENNIRDMQTFLRRLGGVKCPDELQRHKQRNSCLGLLVLLRDMFHTARWELLHESAALLRNCIDMLMPGIPQP